MAPLRDFEIFGRHNPGSTSIAIRVSPRSELQQLLDRHFFNSGCSVSGDPKVVQWHEPETGGRGCHRLLAGASLDVLMFNAELVRVLCEKLASETDPQNYTK